MPSPAELYQRAVDCHRAGDLAQAASLYRQTLEIAPGEPQVSFLLGLANYQAGDFRGAVEFLRQAVAGFPDQAGWHNQLGMALLRSEQRSEGKRSLERALQLQPSLAEAQYNFGNALFEEGDFTRAADCFRCAAEVEPANGNFLAAHGQTLVKLGRFAEAECALRQALAAVPNDARLHCDLADALLGRDREADAIAEFGRAAALDPALARAPFGAGCAETARRNYAAAATCFERAFAIDPGWAEAQHNLGQALFNLGEVEEALAWFRKAAEQRPAEAEAMIAVIIPGNPASGAGEILSARRAFAVNSLPKRRPAARFSGRRRGARLRLGYVSSFFHRPNWMKPVWALINAHDRERFEIHMFSDAPLSAIEGGYRPQPSDIFHDISRASNEEAADQVEAAAVDLLIDLNGYSAVHRLGLVALQPAPVVCGWFNYYATSGIEGCDYLIGDRTVIAACEEASYPERVLTVPGSYLTFDVSYNTPPVSAPGLSDSRFRFGCLAPLYKITPGCIHIWADILARTDSTLTLKNRAFAWPEAADRIRRAFERTGIGAERLRLLGPSPHFEFLDTYSEIDLALDTFPYNGGTTTTEALWQGVPVLTFRGDRWVSRTSASILNAARLGEFVAADRAVYTENAVAIANSSERRDQLHALRASMRSRLLGSPVCAAAPFARRMERLYAKIAPTY